MGLACVTVSMAYMAR